MYNFLSIMGTIVVTLFVACALDLLAALPVMWLWNWLMPMLFGLPTITWLQAFGLNLLFSLLFPTSVKTSNK